MSHRFPAANFYDLNGDIIDIYASSTAAKTRPPSTPGSRSPVDADDVGKFESPGDLDDVLHFLDPAV